MKEKFCRCIIARRLVGDKLLPVVIYCQFGSSDKFPWRVNTSFLPWPISNRQISYLEHTLSAPPPRRPQAKDVSTSLIWMWSERYESSARRLMKCLGWDWTYIMSFCLFNHSSLTHLIYLSHISTHFR